MSFTIGRSAFCSSQNVEGRARAAGRLFSEQRSRIRATENVCVRSSMTYTRYKLLCEAQNTSKTYGFLVSPPQAGKFLSYFPPIFWDPGGEVFFPPPYSETQGGKLKKRFPPKWGGKKQPLNSLSTECILKQKNIVYVFHAEQSAIKCPIFGIFNRSLGNIL